MPEFTHSWAFWFLVVVISFAAGFILAIILAASSKDSRTEEKMSDTMFKAVEEGRSTFSKMAHETKIVTQNDPRTD